MPYASVDRFSINHYPKLLTQITKNAHKYYLQSCGSLSDAHMHSDVNIFFHFRKSVAISQETYLT